MHIAQVAPLTEAIPPKLYGGTERVVSWLTEELIALGHEVTLFASGDSVTSARLEAVWPRALRLDGAVRDPNALHMMMLERVYQRAGGFRFPALSSRLLSVLAVFAAADAVRDDAARPARSARAPAGVRYFQLGAGGVDFQCAAPAAAAGAIGCAPCITACRSDLLTPKPVKPSLFRAFSAASRRKRASIAPSASPQHCGVPLKVAAKVDRADQEYYDEQIEPMMQVGKRRVYRRDQRRGKIGILERRDRAARSDRLARAVRPGDDRSHGLRHAGHRLQSRIGAGDHRRRPHRLHRRGSNRRDRRGRPAGAIVAREDPQALRGAVHRAAHGAGLSRRLSQSRRTASRRICGWSPTTPRRCNTRHDEERSDGCPGKPPGLRRGTPHRVACFGLDLIPSPRRPRLRHQQPHQRQAGERDRGQSQKADALPKWSLI